MSVQNYFNTVLYKETGVHHIERRKGCEDNVYRTVCKETGVAVVTLSDGAGSCSNAAAGSDITSRVAGEELAQYFDLLYDYEKSRTADYLLGKINLALLERAESDGADIMSYSATLLCAAMHPDGRYITFHVGDGAIIGYNFHHECETVSLYKHEGAVNETHFVTMKKKRYNLNKGKGGFNAFILMSDGPEPCLVNEIQISPRNKLIAQLSFFTSEEAMHGQLASMCQLFKDKKDMDDDASFAIIMDMRRISNVFNALTPELKHMLSNFNADVSQNKAKMKQMYTIMEFVALYPQGVTIDQLSKVIHVDQKYVKKKVIRLKFLKYQNGKIYFG